MPETLQQGEVSTAFPITKISPASGRPKSANEVLLYRKTQSQMRTECDVMGGGGGGKKCLQKSLSNSNVFMFWYKKTASKHAFSCIFSILVVHAMPAVHAEGTHFYPPLHHNDLIISLQNMNRSY